MDQGPYQIAVILIDGFALMSYASAVEPLRAANLLAGQELYRIETLTPLAAGPATSSGGAMVPAVPVADRARHYDLVLVAAGGDPFRARDPGLFQMLRAAAAHGTRLGGISGGPVILAQAGVMRGRRMTVHWEHAAALAERDPDLLLERSLFVIDRDRVTCAGGTAPLDLMHAVIAGREGAAFARQVSDWFLHTEVRPSGGPQRAGLVERYRVTDRGVVAAIEAMRTHIADPLDLGGLSTISGIGRRQLNRRFRETLNSTTMGFYRNMRLDVARRLIAQSTLTVTEVALATGFASSAHLSRAYRHRFGQPPSATRRQGHPTGPASAVQ